MNSDRIMIFIHNLNWFILIHMVWILFVEISQSESVRTLTHPFLRHVLATVWTQSFTLFYHERKKKQKCGSVTVAYAYRQVFFASFGYIILFDIRSIESKCFFVLIQELSVSRWFFPHWGCVQPFLYTIRFNGWKSGEEIATWTSSMKMWYWLNENFFISNVDVTRIFY